MRWNGRFGGLASGHVMRARALGARYLSRGGRASSNNGIASRPASFRLHHPTEFASSQSRTARRSAFAISTLQPQSLQETMTIGSVTNERELLPVDVRPMHYDLCVEPDLEAKVFSGTVKVTVKVINSTSSVVLNAHELELSKVELEGIGPASSIELDEKLQRATFTFPQPLPEGEHTIAITYTGILNDKMAGFYASTYEDEGVQKTMAVTQFEAVDARRALPCWDEPSLKATFAVSLVVPSALVAVSNMPETSAMEMEGNRVKRSFETTPIMSTYLLAFVVGEFDMIKSATASGVAIRCYTPRGKSVQGEFALDVAVKALEFYDRYFEIKYPLPKLDLLAIPDFAAGAMENWGCVTYRSTALLVDPDNSSASTRQWVALVVAHELAHQWFGNLVTMEWWTDLWLNEGFATWVEYLAVDYLFPSWKIWTQFVYQDFGRALQLDALESSHPIEVPVSRASDVDEIFDHISYCKGSSVIRMLVDYLGQEPFRVGMVKYLRRFKYGNASTNHLWEVLGQSAGKPVLEVMEKWTRQQGFPVIYAEMKQGQLSVKQERFLLNGVPQNSTETWTIPLMICSASQSEIQTFSFKDAESTFDVEEKGWLKLNAGQSGIYRVRYSAQLLAELQKAIQNKLLSEPADRLGVQNDAIALSRAGLLPTVDVLTLLKSYAGEENYTVWADVLGNNVSELRTLLMHTSAYGKFKLFVQDLLRQIVANVGWDSDVKDDHLQSLLRSLVVPKLGIYGDRDTIAEACKRFDAFVASDFNEGISPDLRAGVFSIALIERQKEAYETLFSLYRSTDLQEEKVRVLGSLGSIPDVVLLQKSLDFAFSKEVRSQDVMFVVNGVANNPLGTDLAWTWLQTNWEKIVEKFGSGFTIGRLITYSTTNFNSTKKAAEVKAFFAEHPAPGGERAVKQAIEKIESNANWLERDLEGVQSWLNANY